MGGVTVRKMIGFTDGSASGYGFVLKMAVFTDGSLSGWI